jgi:hypothetical protein
MQGKRDLTNNVAAADSEVFTEWKFHCDEPAIQAALGGMQLTYHKPQDAEDSDWWVIVPEVDGYSSPPGGLPLGIRGKDVTTLRFAAYKTLPDYEDVYVTATREKITFTKSGETYVTPTGVKSIAIPKYKFVDTSITNGVVTVAPYTNAKLVSDGTAFSVVIGGENGYTRDCVLRVECGKTAPKINWGYNFHPRTDAEMDFACEAGKLNVYWITEYAPNEFCVACWQATTGGNAQ